MSAVKIRKIVSGGQTGVDRAALDAALELKIPCGGWCPAGRKAEDGRIEKIYPLCETPTDVYAERTEWNVRDSDATLILCPSEPTGGTAMTAEFARALRKPFCIVKIDDAAGLAKARQWLAKQSVSTLNVAGPRESGAPGIYRQAKEFLTRLLTMSS